jgi:hypothetical protein
MSLSDLVPVALACEVPRRRLGRTEVQRRYRKNNRAKYNAYRRQWYRTRKAV